MGFAERYTPTRVDERIDTLDVLRGVAICGILLMNIPVMGAIGENQGLVYPAAWNADWVSWIVQQLLFEGTMRGLFTMLFGAGLLLMLRRAEGIDAQVAPFDIWARRCLALMLLGVVQFALFLWPGEILWTYGLAGFALLAFRTARPRALCIAAAIILCALGGFRAFGNYGRVTLLEASVPAEAAKQAGKRLDEKQQAAIDAAKEARDSYHPSRADIAKEYAQRTHLPGVLQWSAKRWAEGHIGPFSWLSVAEQIGFMLIGMALFRSGILTGTATPAIYRRLILYGYGTGLLIRITANLWLARTGFDFDAQRLNVAASMLRGFAYEPARLAITLGHVGLIVSLWQKGALGRAWPVRAMGRTALTVYSLQSILTSLLFYGCGLLGRFGFAGLMGVAAATWVLTGCFSVWWLRGHAMGPAEAALRGLAYGTCRRRPAVLAATQAVPAL